MDCPVCGEDLVMSDADVDIGGGWVTVTITCASCGAELYADVNSDNFDTVEEYEQTSV